MTRGVVVAFVAAVAFSSQAWANDVGDAKAGEKVFNKCKACHTVEEGGKRKVGPGLFGVVGRKAGATEGYKYSPSYPEAGEKGVVWTEENIFKYLEDPKAFIREVTGDKKARSKMVFKLKNEKQRQDVIAFLKTKK